MKMKSVLAATMIASLGVSGGVQAKELVFAHALSPTHSVAVHGFDPWMQCVVDATKGEITFSYYPSGQIANIMQAMSGLNDGLMQLSFVAVSVNSGTMPLSGIGMLPNMGSTSAQMSAAYREMVDNPTLIRDEFVANRIHPLVINTLPTYQLLSVKDDPVDTMAEFHGLKTSVGGGAMNFTVASAGGVPVEMAAGDFYLALERRTVDASILSLSSAKTYNLAELLKSISSNGSFGTAISLLAMDANTYEGLSPEQQVIFDDCGLKAEANLAAALDDANTKLFTEFADLGIDVYEFPPEEHAKLMALLGNASKDYIARLEARGLPAQEVYDAYRKILDN